MAHFLALVLITSRTEDIDGQVASLLAPYDRNLEVEPYFTACDCVSRKAEDYGSGVADQSHSFEKYWELPVDSRPDWQTFCSERRQIQEAAARTHPFYLKSDPDCEDCAGTGTVLSTDNPHGKLDWWQIGGRFTGILDKNYDPANDIENIEWCELCQGTGEKGVYYRDEQTGLYSTTPSGPEAQPIQWCNGCEGKGMRAKWPTEWKRYEGDVSLVSDLPQGFLCYALVAPGGGWYENGGKGEEGQWEDEIKALLKTYFDCLAVVVDCHS